MKLLLLAVSVCLVLALTHRSTAPPTDNHPDQMCKLSVDVASNPADFSEGAAQINAIVDPEVKVEQLIAEWSNHERARTESPTKPPPLISSKSGRRYYLVEAAVGHVKTVTSLF